jgi:hypothetical protein
MVWPVDNCVINRFSVKLIGGGLFFTVVKASGVLNVR